MDLCLRGSQVHLATREKPQSRNLPERSVHIINNLRRPRSATYQFKRSSASPTPFLYRPQSADAKYERPGYGSIFSEDSQRHFARKNLINQKRYKSLSSSSILKLLLDEPISRNTSSSELNFESNTLRKPAKAEKLRSKNYECNAKKMSSSLSSNILNDKVLKRKPNYNTSNINFEKADLPGRVSFFKADMANDLDYSDSENDRHDQQEKIQQKDDDVEESNDASSPFMYKNYNTSTDFATKLASAKSREQMTFASPSQLSAGDEKESSSACSKKQVHFGHSGNESVLSETYFYTNITSENCSGSTRSSSSASTSESPEVKCNCCAHKTQAESNHIQSAAAMDFKDTKNTNNPEDQLQKFTFDFQTSDKRRNETKELTMPKLRLEENESRKSVEQNNFSSKDLDKNTNKDDDNNSFKTKSSEVLKNYLAVSSSAAVIYQKELQSDKKLPTFAERKVPLELTKSKKVPPRLGPNREDSNLTEFRLDEIESWISVHDAIKPNEETNKVNEKHMKEHNNDNLQTEEHNDVKSEDQDDFTYDDIVSVIKEIEEDKKKDNFAEKVCNDMELKLNSNAHECEIAAKATREKVETPDKYKDILNYLDEIDDSCDKALLETRRSLPDSSRSEIEFVIEPDITEDVPKLPDLLLLPNHQLARRVIALSLRANELANALHLSKENVSKARHEKQKATRLEKANGAVRLRDLKKHYEDAVKRHQGFIEQLLKDKGSLCEKIAALTRRLESQNHAWEHRMETEVTRAKETTLAGEKIKRERWVRENTKKIKELTVKGLEAEINKMNAAHQLQINELKRLHQEQLLEALEEARHKHEQIENSIRESSAQDREMILDKERTAIRQRFERQMEQERKSFEDQKAKMSADFHADRERLENELKAKDADYQMKRQELLREKQYELEMAISELENKMSKQDEKYQNRINTIEKQFESDYEIWKRDFENEYKLLHVEKENIIRQHYRDERDRQIDEIVKRMDAEALKNAQEHEAKINRLKQKYEHDLQLLENAEKTLCEKYNETRIKLAESDGQVKNLEAEIKQLHVELEHTKKMCHDAEAERDQLRENLRNEVRNEVAALKEERDSEIERIHKRVQQAIEKKDVTIELLQKETNGLRERCLKLEAVIRQQRKDYCAK